VTQTVRPVLAERVRRSFLVALSDLYPRGRTVLGRGGVPEAARGAPSRSVRRN
jgi:hypothetical protein